MYVGLVSHILKGVELIDVGRIYLPLNRGKEIRRKDVTILDLLRFDSRESSVEKNHSRAIERKRAVEGIFATEGRDEVCAIG